MRELLASDRPEARVAVALFCYHIIRDIDSLAAALGWLGVDFDDEANRRGETRATTTEFSVPVPVLPTNEEGMIARHTAAMMG